MRIWICGSGTAKSYAATEVALNKAIPDTTNVIIRTGYAKGIDQFAEQWARNYNVKRESPLVPNWKIGKHAGLLRSEEGIDWAEKVIAIWDGNSPGTLHCIEYAEQTGTPLKVIMFE